GQLADLGDGLDGADLVVRHHDRHQRGLWPQAVAHGAHVYHAVAVNGQHRGLETLLAQPVAGRQHGPVLDGAGDYLVAAVLFAHGVGDAADGSVVTFSAAAGEDDFVGV